MEEPLTSLIKILKMRVKTVNYLLETVVFYKALPFFSKKTSAWNVANSHEYMKEEHML